MSLTASAPGKLLLFGDHAVVYGYPCIVTAVDQRINVTVRKNGADVFLLDAPDLGLQAYSKTISDLGEKGLPKAVAFVEMLYKRFLEKYPQREGIVVTTKSEFSSTFGFGSSSAVTVAFAKALTTLYDMNLSNQELFELCYQAVLDVQGVGSGFDIASAIWGGTIYYVTPAKVVEKLAIETLPLVVGYTGIKADTATLVRMVEGMRKEQPEVIESIFTREAKVVEQAKTALLDKDWPTVGQLMRTNQELLQHLKVSGLKLEELIEAAQNAGAYGAKLSGAGGGDCKLAIGNDENQVAIAEALTKAGGTVMQVRINAQGVRIEP